MKELTHSKTFRYELGHIHFKATTVGELTSFLAQFPADMPVLSEWEGTIHSLTYPEVESYDDCECLIFSAEHNLTE